MPTRRPLAGLLLAVACIAAPAPAQTNPPPAVAPAPEVRDLSPLLAPIIKTHDIPGMAAAIVVGNHIVAHGVAGVRKADHPEKITLADKFHLGSCTKSMTATMIATLVEEGTLKWDTTIGDVFPEVTMDPQWRSVRLDQLLSNSSGAPTGLDANGLWGRLWRHSGTPVEQRMALVEGVLASPPAARPGTRYIYSNAGFAIAGAMAETITDTPWEDLMRSRIFTPLGMTSAGFGPPGARGSIDQPRGHRANGPSVEPGPNADNPAAIGPAGIVHCSIDDWARYISLHLEGAQSRASLLLPETFTLLHSPMKLEGSRSDYARGWVSLKRGWARGDAPNDTGRVLTHNGTNTMWFCVTWIAPEKNFALLIACNKGGPEAEKACDNAAGALIKFHKDQTPAAPAP